MRFLLLGIINPPTSKFSTIIHDNFTFTWGIMPEISLIEYQQACCKGIGDVAVGRIYLQVSISLNHLYDGTQKYLWQTAFIVCFHPSLKLYNSSFGLCTASGVVLPFHGLPQKNFGLD